MKNRSVQLGIIGCGRVAKKIHLPAFQWVKNASIVAASDTDKKRLTMLCNRFNIKQTYTDYLELLANNDVDAVIIATPPNTHAQIILDVLKSNKHVFCEKPLATTIEDARDVIKCSAKTNVKNMIGFNKRFWDIFVRTKNIVAQNVIGTPLAINSIYNVNESEYLVDNTLFEQGIHYIDLFRWLFDTEIQEAYARVKSTHLKDDTVTLLTKLENGMFTNSIFCTYTTNTRYIEIYGTKGKVVSDVNKSIYPTIMPILSPQKEAMKNLLSGFHSISMAKYALTSYKLHSFIGEFNHFVECILNNKEPSPGFVDGYKALEVIEAAYESIEKKNTIVLKFKK